MKQISAAIALLVATAQSRRLPLSLSQLDSEFWTNGNGGGSEKHDVFWEQGHFSKSAEEFNQKAARETLLSSENQGDKEPSQKSTTLSAAQRLSGNGYWEDGNGGSSEKHDLFWEQAHDAKTKDDFDHKAARETLIPSVNHGDKEPTLKSTTLSAAQVQNQKGYWEDGNGGGSEKHDLFWEQAHFSHSSEDFNHKAARQTTIPSLNGGDKSYFRRSAHSLSQWNQNGDGFGSEKTDFFSDVAQTANSAEDFYKKAGSMTLIPAMNKADSEPVDHPIGLSDIQIQKSESGDQAKQWWWNYEAKEAKTTKEFYDRVAKPTHPSYNHNDKEPTSHPNGMGN